MKRQKSRHEAGDSTGVDPISRRGALELRSDRAEDPPRVRPLRLGIDDERRSRDRCGGLGGVGMHSTDPEPPLELEHLRIERVHERMFPSRINDPAPIQSETMSRHKRVKWGSGIPGNARTPPRTAPRAPELPRAPAARKSYRDHGRPGDGRGPGLTVDLDGASSELCASVITVESLDLAGR